MIYRRAATAVAQCGSQVDKAKRELVLAIEILTDLEDPLAPWPDEPGRRQMALRPLQELLRGLDEIGQALSRARALGREAADGTVGERPSPSVR